MNDPHIAGASAQARSERCERCGATARLTNGVCLRCLLGEGLEADSEASQAAFESVLGEADVPDNHWRIGNYEILEEIHRGGMGVVYRARQRHSRRIVALKRVLSYHAGSHEALERFRREAEAASNLDHPNILPIYEVGTSDDGLPFFSMKYVAGGTLQQLQSGLRGDRRRCIEIMARVARAVDYAHTRGVLHRDLKPGNILLDAHGEPLVSDFGLAKTLNADRDLTTAMTAFGTPGFMAPEQAQGNASELTAAADVYSLGAVLFELLVGRPAFLGDNALSVIRQASDTAAPRLRALDSTIDRDLETICARCLERAPGNRYQTAAALADDLEHWLAGRPIAARPVSLPVRAWRWSRRNPRLVAAGIAGVLLGAAIIALFRESLFPGSAAESGGRTIAVLPFVDLSQARDQEYFCDGMSEEILHALGKVEGLQVVARSSSFSFKGTNASVRDIGKKLNAGNVLEGSVRRQGNRIRVAVELIDARNGFQRWAETYDREVQDLFGLQNEITRKIVDALKIKFAIASPVGARPDPEVYDLYLQGLYFSNKSSERDLRLALSFFERAVEKDPAFAKAWTGIAKVWYFLADVYVRPLDAYPKAKDAALRAIALDDQQAEAHCYLGEAKRVLDWDLNGADADLNRALELDPNSAPAHFFSALLPLFRGDMPEGLRLILRAKKLDPVSPITSYVATAAYLANDRINDAIIEGQRTLQLDPNYFYLDSALAAAYREAGNFPAAIDLYKKAETARGLPSTGLAITYVRMGRQPEARRILDQLVQLSEQRYVSAPAVAAVYVALGENEQAFHWLERAFAEHSAILQWIAFMPEFRPLRSDVRFPALLRRAGISHEPVLTITESSLSTVADPNAREHFALRIGVKPRPGTENGHVVRITVSFFDQINGSKLVPTNAQVGYNWLTQTRDWTDATPKFMAAAYIRPKIGSVADETRRYGGFIVGVYFDGRLQDLRAVPVDLAKLFPLEQQLPTPSTVPRASP